VAEGNRLTVRIYRVTESFPKSELYGLTSQMQRASVSVASNIAEGKREIERRRITPIPWAGAGVGF
jgi:four helix bundle protein